MSFDKLDYCSSLNNTRALDKRHNFAFYHGDLTNPTEVLDCMERHAIDTVLHFAAQSHVDLSFKDSYSFTHANVYGTHVLLECAKNARIQRFIHVSTDEVYGEVKEEDDDMVESSILSPTNPYAASKAAAEMLVQSYNKSFKLPTIIVRSNNVYGPHQYPESKLAATPILPPLSLLFSFPFLFLFDLFTVFPSTSRATLARSKLTFCGLEIIPKFTCLLNRARPVVLHGDGSPTRRYLYAGDAADAFDTILHKGQIGHIYNVDSCDEISNLDLCAKLLDTMGIEHGSPNSLRKWIKYTHDRPFNDRRYAVDGTKLRMLGWKQKTNLQDGLKTTVDWYCKYGEFWWGDISHVLSPFLIVSDGRIMPGLEHLIKDEPLGRADDDSSADIDENIDTKG